MDRHGSGVANARIGVSRGAWAALTPSDLSSLSGGWKPTVAKVWSTRAGSLQSFVLRPPPTLARLRAIDLTPVPATRCPQPPWRTADVVRHVAAHPADRPADRRTDRQRAT